MVPTSFDPLLVWLSIAVAVFASFTALELATRMRTSEGLQRHFWLGSAALAMGGGIWSMHFVGMLAFHMPMPVSYDVALTTLSALLPVLVSGIGLHTAFIHAGRAKYLALAGLFMGCGIVTMHYTGMAAARFHAMPPTGPASASVLEPGILAVAIAAASSLILVVGLMLSVSGARNRVANLPSDDASRGPDQRLLLAATILFFATLVGATWGIAAWLDYRRTFADTAARNEEALALMERRARDMVDGA